MPERILELWNGAPKEEPANIKVKQPIANQHQPSQSDHLVASSILPSDRSLTTMPQQQNVNFNNMYAETQTPLEQANIPTMEPIAANETGGFSSW